MIFLFTSKDCPKCKAVKETFKAMGKEFKEKDIDTTDGMTDYYFYNKNNHIGLPMIIEVDDHEAYVKDLTKDFGD
jgi:glutaredoxin